MTWPALLLLYKGCEWLPVLEGAKTPGGTGGERSSEWELFFGFFWRFDKGRFVRRRWILTERTRLSVALACSVVCRVFYEAEFHKAGGYAAGGAAVSGGDFGDWFAGLECLYEFVFLLA